MSRIVMKFGGTSVADLDRIRNVAARVKREVEAGNEVAVVVSAMAGVTNQLVAWCQGLSPLHDAREYDAVVATGEQVTTGLLAIALQEIGVEARSWQGWQIPIRTDNAHGKARIAGIEGAELIRRMQAGQVAVVAGFQGIGPDNRVTTLGRGGSDTSAVALAAALQADRCDIYTDVDGVYTTDPRIVPRARKLAQISYEEMLELASVGAKVLQTRSVELAMNERVRVQVLSSFEDVPGTLVVDEDEIVEKQTVSGIAYSRDDAKITLRRVPDRPGIAAAVFGALAEHSINVDMIVQNVSADGMTDMTFTVGKADLPRAQATLAEAQSQIGFSEVLADPDVAKISVVGVGMRSHAGVANTMFRALADKAINIQVISTSEIKVSVLIGGGIHRTGGARAAHRLRSRCRLTSPRPTSRRTAARAELDRLWARGTAFLGCRVRHHGRGDELGERAAPGGGDLQCRRLRRDRLRLDGAAHAGGRDRRHPGADRPAIRREPDHHASAARRSDPGLPGGAGRPRRAGGRHSAGRRGARGEGRRGEADRFTPALVLAKRLVRSGADALVIEGSEAGGHIGPVSLMVLAQEILPQITDVPVFVAGGLGRGEAILALLEMGAAGAQLGTRFAAASESIAHPSFKQRLHPRRRARRSAVGAARRALPGHPGARTGQRRGQALPALPGRNARPVRGGRADQGRRPARDRAFLGGRAAARGDRRRCRERLGHGGAVGRHGDGRAADGGDHRRTGRAGRRRAAGAPAGRRMMPREP